LNSGLRVAFRGQVSKKRRRWKMGELMVLCQVLFTRRTFTRRSRGGRWRKIVSVISGSKRLDGLLILVAAWASLFFVSFCLCL
jgi:hypothetical protein